MLDGFEGLTVLVTRLDNTSETLDLSELIQQEEQVSSLHLQWSELTFSKHTSCQWYNTTTGKVYYKESYSPEVELVVQEEPLPYYPGAPLPNEYWSRPINVAQLREWYTISETGWFQHQFCL